MKIKKINWVRLCVGAFLALLFAMGWVKWGHAERDELERIYPQRREIRLWEENGGQILQAPKLQIPLGGGMDFTNTSSQFITKKADMTDEQKKNLARMFTGKFLPALEHWSAAYSNRIPFDVAEVTLDKFHSALGSHMFTFMLGSTTLTFVDSKDPAASAIVGYLMVRQAAVDMNNLPKPGFMPELNLPISTDEVLRMVKADLGVEFKPNEVIIRPTGKASALNGGAFVDLLPSGADPNNALDYKISMVIDANGKLVNYERDPFFGK